MEALLNNLVRLFIARDTPTSGTGQKLVSHDIVEYL